MTEPASAPPPPPPRAQSRASWPRAWAGRQREWSTVALAALLLILLAVLAVLQYRWLGRASEADLQRTTASLQAAASRFSTDFNRELADLLAELVPALFHHPGAADVLAGVERWRQRATWPDLVEGVWQIERSLGDAGPAVAPADAVPGSTPVPEALQRLADLLAEDPLLDPPRVLMSGVPAIVLPRPGAFRHGRRGDHRGDRRQPGGEPRHRWLQRRVIPPDEEAAPSLWIVHLDSEVIRDQILPALGQRHFSAETELVLRVLDTDSQVVWTSENGPVDHTASAVAQAELFGPLRPRGRSAFGLGARMHGPLAAAHDVLAAAAAFDHGQWLLEVIHPAGSLDAAVMHARYRSLALSVFILLVLAGSILLLAHGARRAQALARRQLEFVAGVTHELRTPLAALRSAGQNLADGVVKPERVQTYGKLVDREGRRLEEAVGQILAFAGLSTGGFGGHGLRTAALDAVAAAQSAVADLAPLLEERNVEVEVTYPGDPGRVAADAGSLGRALRNLVQNAALHGQPPERDPAATKGWVGVEIEESKGRILFRVRDRGPGIDPSDRKRIYEPFVRGHGLAASNVPGSGLGLALVRQVADAHGGSVSLEVDDQFTTFTLALPSD